MKQLKKLLLIVTVSTVALLWYNPAVLAQNVLAGVDLWETRPGDATFNFGGGPECPPLPTDFFGPGSDPFDGIVAFQGQPLPTTPSGILGSADTIVERLTDATLPSCPSSDTVDIQIVALDLVSTTPITITYNGGQDPESWDVRMCLSSVTPQSLGTKTIDKDCDEGGTFTALIPITPKFIFTRLAPYAQWTIDYGDWGLDPIIYEITDGHWLYDDPGFNIITSLGGVVVDHDCDGVIDAAVGLGSNFYPGLQAVPCDCSSTPADYNMVPTLWQSLACGDHVVYPPQTQAQPTIEPEIATECPVVTTECPAIETVCPEWGDTYCPVNLTYCPKDPYTECPLELTLCPIEFTSCPGGSAPTVCEITNCPTDPTMCPSLETECPVIWTECPIYPTFCEPVAPTLCQQVDTECPMQPTFCTGPITSCPGAMTWCPVLPTLCPIEYTTCPEGPTICPEILTYCPDSNPTVCKITQCPGEPTICTPGGNIQTECPTDFTLCPYNYTWCPGDIPTECPMDWTDCPVIPTVCPDSLTVCPEVITECPEAQTACPVVSTACPEITTECPQCQPDGDYGDAPEGPIAYGNGILGRFPTCSQVGPAGYIVHYDSIVLLGYDINLLPPTPWDWDAEQDGQCDQSISFFNPGCNNCGTSAGDEWYLGVPSYPPETDPDAGVPGNYIPPCSPTAMLKQVFFCNNSGAPVDVYFNALFDWNQDGDWDDTLSCPPGGSPASEWAIQNVWVDDLPSGCYYIDLPFTSLSGPFSDVEDFWMRVTVTTDPIDPDSDYPENGGEFPNGETEDYFFQPTVLPEVATECPVVVTECPVDAPTMCEITECLVVSTTCPEIYTECPTDPTTCQVTECPYIETSCPTGSTWCPATETQCPTGATWCPTDPTSCPMYNKDYDGYYDDCDNCPDVFNPGQEDNYPPGGNSSPPTDNCGDACECEGDVQSASLGVGYSDGDVDGSDAFVFKQQFGRTDCATSPPCYRDHECDGDVDGSDAYKFKVDFGRTDCPPCTFICVYP